MALTDSIAKIKGIGSARFAILQSGGMQTVSDLLGYLPRSYEDSTKIISIPEAITEIRQWPVWGKTRHCLTVQAKLGKINSFRTKRGLFLIKVELVDEESGETAQAIWFNQEYITQELKQGESYVFYGNIGIEGSHFIFQSPKFERVESGKPLRKLGGILPVYRKVKSVTSTYIRNFIQEVLKTETMSEYLPTKALASTGVSDIGVALKQVHSPSGVSEIERGFRRLALQELLEVRAEYEETFLQAKSELPHLVDAKSRAKRIAAWLTKLPFALTNGQQSVLSAILEDMAQNNVLDGLQYGDVGSGKTIIALLLLFACSMADQCAIFIAPTTILARQHVETALKFRKIVGLESDLAIVEVTAGSRKLKLKSKTLYIGTQAILHQKALLNSPEVGFVCIDEQHRLGVEQRLILKGTGRPTLTLSATPIPRTLALSFLGFSQTYFLNEKPVGRLPIITKVVPSGKEEITYAWLATHVKRGSQAYLVFPRIEQGDETDQQSLLATAEILKTAYFTNIETGLLHGGMKDAEKQKIMADFSSGKIRLLFSTTVIEVGVDVPNASVMAIHGAEMFGLAQLHQLRGRVGRSSKQGYCLLFPGEASETARQRLQFFSDHSEGLQVAEYDLQHRGTGTLLGSEQSGLSELKIASVNDLSLFKDAMSIFNELRERHIAIPRIFRVKSERDQ